MLAVQFHQLVLKASEADIPLVFPVFPRIATDWEYLHRSLRPILPPEITEDVARAAHTKVADAAKVRVTREIFKDPGNVVYRREAQFGSRYPSPTEIDNIALRREISRLRQEQKQQLPARELADRLEAQLRTERQERAGLESALQRLHHKLERRSIKYNLRRVLELFNAAEAVGA